MVKINAQVEESTRESIRKLALAHGSSVQSVTSACIEAGFRSINAMQSTQLAKLLQPDRRRAPK
jgi:hypothetical protein